MLGKPLATRSPEAQRIHDEIIARLKNGETAKALSDETGIGAGTIRSWKTEDRRKRARIFKELGELGEIKLDDIGGAVGAVEGLQRDVVGRLQRAVESAVERYGVIQNYIVTNATQAVCQGNHALSNAISALNDRIIHGTTMMLDSGETVQVSLGVDGLKSAVSALQTAIKTVSDSALLPHGSINARAIDLQPPQSQQHQHVHLHGGTRPALRRNVSEVLDVPVAIEQPTTADDLSERQRELLSE